MPFNLSPLIMKAIGAGLIVLLIAGLWIRGNHFENQRGKERVAHRQTIENVKRAQDQALAAAVAARNATEARYRALAERTDANAQATRKVADNASDRYIAGNRCVRGAETFKGASKPTAASPQGSDPGVPAGVPSGGELVAVEPADVRACGAATAYALAAREWALSLAQ